MSIYFTVYKYFTLDLSKAIMMIFATLFIVSRWLKESLNKTGLDIVLLLGHSTREGSTIKANVTGASVFDKITQV